MAAWLRQILERLIISQRRRLHSQKASAGLEAPIEGIQIVDSSPSVTQAALSTELGQQVQAAIATLPELYRDVIVLRHFKQLTFEEIASRLEKSPDAVRKTWARAILKLQIELKTQVDSGVYSANP